VELKVDFVLADLFCALLSFWWQSLRNGDEFQELLGFDLESVGEAQDAVEGDRALAPLDPPYVVPVEVTHLRELLLGEMPFSS